MLKRRIVFFVWALSTVFFLGNLSLQSAELESAYMKIFVSTTHERMVGAHQVTSEWTELGVTWDTAPSYNPVAEIIFLPGSYSWYEIDITSLFQEWMGGAPSHGVMLMEPDPGYPAQLFVSSNDAEPEYRPYLEVTYIVDGNPVVEVYPCAGDSHIYKYYGDANYGLNTKIFTGLWQEPTSDHEVRGLFQFELPAFTGELEVEVDYMKVRDLKHCGSTFDSIFVKGDIVLDEGADPFDPETDDVTLSINDETITIPAGSFQEKSCWGKHYFKFCGDLPCEGWAFMYLNFECETWWISIWDKETVDLVASEGVDLELSIGTNVGEDSFDWCWKYENSCMGMAKYWD